MEFLVERVRFVLRGISESQSNVPFYRVFLFKQCPREG